jgi:lambda family phage portal protein
LARRWAESARGNWLASQSPTAVSLTEKWASHCIASGPTARSAHPDESVRRAWENIFATWSARCDVEGVDDLVGTLNCIIRTIVSSGEIFIRLVTTRRGELRLQLLSPEQIDPTRNEELTAGGKIVAGIEYNSAGERVAYHVLPEAPDMLFAMVGPPVRVPASEIIHVYERKLPGQPRGTSWLGPLASRLLLIDQLEDALLAAFVTDPEGSFTRDGSTGAAATRTNQFGDTEMSLEPGLLRVLPPGCAITFPTVPDTLGVPELLKHILRSVSSGGGMPYELLTGDLSDANYSSARLSLQSFQRRVRALQLSMLGNRLLLPVWQRLVTLEVLSGRMYARDFERRADNYFAVSFLWPEWPSIDPLKDAKADTLEVNAGLKSRQELIAARGRDPAEVFEEIEADPVRPDIAATSTALLTQSDQPESNQ